MNTRRFAAILAADVAGFSALMERDEEGTAARIRELRREVVEPALSRHAGRLVKTTGDGFLVEFASPVEAVRSAVAMQEVLAAREQDSGDPVRMRIGINLGDVLVEEDGDLYGDGVNVAARLEQIAEPGGIAISGTVFDVVDGKIGRAMHDAGEQRLKNISRPIRVYTLAPAGGAAPSRMSRTEADAEQEIRFCRSPDGVRLAWASSGRGPPLVKAANWMNHLKLDWESPIARHMLRALGQTRTLYRYDARGNGLSDWDVPELSLDAFVRDLETVVDAAGLDRFPLLGMSQGCAVSIAYAVRHPERVSHLVLYGGFALGGYRRSSAEREKRQAMAALMRLGWDGEDPTFRQMFASQLIPDATKEQVATFTRHQRETTTGECAARYYEAVGNFDVRDLLEKVSVPTLVMHVRGDLVCPIEAGRAIAGAIPGARFVTLPGTNHIPIEGDPASDRFLDEIGIFLDG